MSKRMRHMRQHLESVDGAVSFKEGMTLVKKTSSAKFDETVDVAVRLLVDTKSGQAPRGVVNLPGGTGKSVRVAVFARADKAKEATEAGADIVGAENLVERIEKGEANFDRCIATPDMMALVGRLGRFLGPRGLMPNPRLGTVTMDVAKAVQAAKGGQIEYKTDKTGVVHAGIGKASFDGDVLVQNMEAFMDALVKAKPASVKGVYIKSAYVSSTMGPSVKLSLEGLA
ncbi:50S ribosomal protein L1 [Candidatus Hepatobacter penaei]|uniref:50S ribosomal protein L1 n=1 Tax=Candidatus Hepatobacter penaei TaxID=1274402 RepID=UPI0004F3E759|nr:50S ribosomal protein L1 [Candidatus Hepatobacter penaei]